MFYIKYMFWYSQIHLSLSLNLNSKHCRSQS
nr:MAG TPA_asm: hypothetical protein [Bacteriophage sp.]